MIPNVGDSFRQFHVLAKVGEGGMGEVFRAQDTKLGRDVALKFLTRVHPVDFDTAERLRREARSLAALNHGNIVTIYDLDEIDGVPFLVLEWISGKTLNDAPDAKPSSEETFLRTAVAVAEALAAAHERGIVHRDLKPSNVLITNQGQIKLVDFGLAKLREGDSRVTKTATVVGTMAYMSPEQATGAEIGPASDVFSFGTLAYELLTGQPPFTRTSEPATLYAIVHEPHVPIAKQRADLTEATAGLVERCLAKNPDARFANGSELAQELRRISRGSVPAGSRESAIRRLTSDGHTVATPKIQFCTAADGARIAYSVVGSGPLLIRSLGWFTHLEMEWEWPSLRLLWERLAEQRTVVRYDGRGIGLSDPWTQEFSEESRQLDLEAVMDAVGAKKEALFGISEGSWTAAMQAVRHPDRVSRLVLYGGYSRGAGARPGYDQEEDLALQTLMRKGWGKDTPTFRQLFTSLYFRPDAEPGLIAHFNQLQRASADPETAVRYVQSLHRRGDGRELHAKVQTPTLVIHCRDDLVVGFDEGRRLAAQIPGAEFLPLPSGTHYFPTDPEVTPKLVDAILRFTQESAS